MLFEKKTSLSLLICNTCQGAGVVGEGRCPECRGLAMGHFTRGVWLYWGHPLTRYYLALERARQIFNKIRLITALVLALSFWIWSAFIVYNRTQNWEFLSHPAEWSIFYKNLGHGPAVLFWLGVICFCYVWYRSIREKKIKGLVEHFHYEKEAAPSEEAPKNWQEVRKINHRRLHNIAASFTDEALTVLGKSYRLSLKLKHNSVTLLHLFVVLLDSNRVSNIFIRLGVSAKSIESVLFDFIKKDPSLSVESAADTPRLSADFQQILFQAYEEAYEVHQEYVSVTELLLATTAESKVIQEILYDLAIDKQKLTNVVEWARIRERLYRQYTKLRRAARHRPKTGMDKAMTAVATPYLNQFSHDLTLLAQFGYTETCVAREKEIEEIFRVLEGGRQNVILVGEHGSGKRSIIDGIAEKMVEDDVPKQLCDKRLVRLSIPSLLAGTTPAGAVERLISIMNEVAHARNIVLAINNIHELIGVSAGTAGQSLDVADTLAEYLNGGRFLTIATTTPEAFARQIVNSTLGNVFTQVEVGEMSEDQAIQVLESKVGMTEYKHKVFFSYNAIAKAVQLSKKFIHETPLPASALEVINEAAILTHNKKGNNSLVTVEEVSVVVAEKTKIPVTVVSSDEGAKLLRLEEEMHKRVIGQEEAVDAVANALRRARAEIRSTTRPIANFLFLGPTGVGKTELAKTIAEVYFGGEQRMIRLDMSEYQDKSSISRLLGASGEKGTGILTEAVRRNPFALLLLDEVEKADKDILNLFLQVMDDGRLTDSSGRVADFTNVILIATSNAATSYVQDQLKAGLSNAAIKDRLLHGELKQYFRPEFLNRFDGIVLFRPLGHEDIKKIAGLMLKRIGKDLEAKGVELKVDDAALEFFSQAGFDPDFGARPLRRVLQEKVENKLAELILSGKLKRRDAVIISEGGNLTVSSR